MVKMISLAFLFIIYFDSAYAQNGVSLKLMLLKEADTLSKYSHILNIRIINKSGNDLYIPYFDFYSHVVLYEKGNGKNMSWCYHNLNCLNDLKRINHRGTDKTDSIMTINDFGNIRGASSFLFLKSGESSSYKIPLCYLMDRSGIFSFQYNSTKLLRCAQDIFPKRFHYSLSRKFRFLNSDYRNLPKEISGFKLHSSVIKSNKIELRLN
jgi:hypothetical protein